jgi:hypothetical protein
MKPATVTYTDGRTLPALQARGHWFEPSCAHQFGQVRAMLRHPCCSFVVPPGWCGTGSGCLGPVIGCVSGDQFTNPQTGGCPEPA